MKETDLSGDGESSTPQPLSRKKRIVFCLIAVLGATLIALMISEVVLRLAGYSSPEFYMAHEQRGYTLIPNMSGTYRKEGVSQVHINPDGFNDIEHSIEKPAGTVRIAVIGDSYVEALQVDRSEAFTTAMREQIEAHAAFNDQRVEVLRFGVSGYGTAQELLLMREKVWKYSPDVVMLLMTTNNDITDNLRSFKKTSIPYFVYTNGELTLDESFKSDRAFLMRSSRLGRLGVWLKNELRFVQAGGELMLAIKYHYKQRRQEPAAPPGPVPAPATQPATPAAEVGIDSQIYQAPAEENWETAWKVTEGLIGMMKSEVEAQGARFIVVTGSNGPQVLPNPADRTAFARSLGTDDLLYPDRSIAEFCRSRSIPVITLAPPLAEYAERENATLHGFGENIGYGHWNKLGHRVAGEVLGKQVSEVVWPR